MFQKRISDTSKKPYKLVKNVDGIIAGKAKSQRHGIESELQKFWKWKKKQKLDTLCQLCEQQEETPAVFQGEKSVFQGCINVKLVDFDIPFL